MKTLTSIFPLPETAFCFAGFSWPRFVCDLPKSGKQKRLERYKRPVCGPYYHCPKPEKAGTGKGFYHESSCAPFRLRWDYCDNVETSIAHKGWFCDEIQDEKIRGLVFILPKKRGFAIGWTMGEGMASTIDCTEIYADAGDAALAADEMAREAAEDQIAYEAEEQARLDAEEQAAEAEELLSMVEAE